MTSLGAFEFPVGRYPRIGQRTARTTRFYLGNGTEEGFLSGRVSAGCDYEIGTGARASSRYNTDGLHQLVECVKGWVELIGRGSTYAIRDLLEVVFKVGARGT